MPIGTSYNNVPDMTMRLREYQQASRQETQTDRAMANTAGPQQDARETASAQSVVGNPETDQVQSLQMQQYGPEQANRATEAAPANEQVRVNDYDAAMGNRIDVFA
jgi:hypothetical protein